MSTAELPCYTLINVLNDSEAQSEQKLAEDLGKSNKPQTVFFQYASKIG